MVHHPISGCKRVYHIPSSGNVYFLFPGYKAIIWIIASVIDSELSTDLFGGFL